MKRIGIDARLFSQTGVGTYLQNLLYYLDKASPGQEIYYVYLREQDAVKINFKSRNIVKKIANQRWHGFSEQTTFLLQLLRDDLDLMHFTYFSYPILYNKKFVATVHDTTPLLFKTGKASTKNGVFYSIKHLIFRLVLYLQVSRSLKIITPSETVKNELIKQYGSKISAKIKIIYEGINHKIIENKENQSMKTKFKNFFVYVGNFYPHKNVENLIRAFSSVPEEYRLVLVGPDDYFTGKIVKQIESLKLHKKITVIRNPPYSDLIFFYKNALAIIQPSLSEGFGLPLVEAAHFGTPIIASNIPIFKELWGNRYLDFNPKNAADIRKQIISFISKPTKFDYRELLTKYSFEEMTRETRKIYDSI
ncbi:glycosyltransferase family 4 protein [Patescibacteria group bacterium]|nr:glycosyltransferase family 4 protein [Patescibacteria group bacterium]